MGAMRSPIDSLEILIGRINSESMSGGFGLSHEIERGRRYEIGAKSTRAHHRFRLC